MLNGKTSQQSLLDTSCELESNHRNGNARLWRFVQNKLFFKLVTNSSRQPWWNSLSRARHVLVEKYTHSIHFVAISVGGCLVRLGRPSLWGNRPSRRHSLHRGRRPVAVRQIYFWNWSMPPAAGRSECAAPKSKEQTNGRGIRSKMHPFCHRHTVVFFF